MEIIIFFVLLGIGLSVWALLSKSPTEETALVRIPQPSNDLELDYKKFEQMMLNESGIPELEYNQRLNENYQKVFDFFNPHSGWLSTYFREKSSEKQVKIVKNMTDTQKMILEHAYSHAKALHERRETAANFYVWMQRNYAELKQIQQNIEYNQKAADNNMLPGTFDFITKLGRESQIRTTETTALEEMRHRHTLENKKLDSEIKITEHKERTETELNNEIRLAENEVRLAIIADTLTDNQKIVLVQELLDDIYRQIEEIHNAQFSPARKRYMIEDRQQSIEWFRKQRNELANRL